MLLLSSLLGPAKPPVATREDVAAAEGVYRLVRIGDTLLIAGTHGTEPLEVTLGERCLVCLGDFNADEEVRQLAKCSHFFHRECIDEVSSTMPPSFRDRCVRRSLMHRQWLTTGRNSCPLCRGQGVDERVSVTPSSSVPLTSTE